MERLVLDTAVWIAIERQQLSISNVLGTHRTLILPAIVAGELRFALKLKARTETQMQRTLDFLALVESLTEFAPLDQRVAYRYAELKHFTSVSGRARGVADLLIAATAVEYRAKLYSTDVKADFGSLPDVLLHS